MPNDSDNAEWLSHTWSITSSFNNKKWHEYDLLYLQLLQILRVSARALNIFDLCICFKDQNPTCHDVLKRHALSVQWSNILWLPYSGVMATINIKLPFIMYSIMMLMKFSYLSKSDRPNWVMWQVKDPCPRPGCDRCLTGEKWLS